MEETVPGVRPTGRDLRSTEKPSANEDPIEAKAIGDVFYTPVSQFPPTQIPTGTQVIGRMMFLLYRQGSSLKLMMLLELLLKRFLISTFTTLTFTP